MAISNDGNYLTVGLGPVFTLALIDSANGYYYSFKTFNPKMSNFLIPK